ncbi:hypothetical protein MPTK1_2g20850 [Marchantia polymorpha subsp. ruderalis]|uniref:Protein FAM184A/B N-terminal domain-containing protein n=1 Tax=Marchantia polymorpha TaxID=3197 RepID=A0A2R6X2Y0_MARPO|nr:hypothetical protein MARPO_0040s0127 [Marchantia polymorpha]BBN03110.1 hypothetical protein Mp_2g20850 [Marchantia polymorpha subsp. ruderalis]|eukprot:PTQ40465.1 hypothetical protein MARPO_0040s0127 [Marchantia polymorpha]
MAMAGEALQDWNQLEDKLASKLAQLTKLLHHFSAFPPEAPDANDDEIAGQHESEIHEILNETASRIRQFKTSLEIQIQDNRVQETIQAMASQYQVSREASEIELKGANRKAEQLEKDMKELEKALEDKNESFVRDSMLLRNELLTKTNEFESAKQAYLLEIDRLKRVHTTEMLAQSEKAEKDLMEATKRQTELQARILHLQEIAKKELEKHTQALEEAKALYKAELERLKLESFVELEKMSQDCAAREAEWHVQDLEFQNKLAEAAKEKVQITLYSKMKAEEGTSRFEAIQQTLDKEKEMTTKLQIALHQSEEENRTLKENLETALISKDNLSLTIETLKQEALLSENSHSAAISEWESQASLLRADLENMTKACQESENDIKTYRIKVEELAFQLASNRRELSLMVMEVDQLKKENEESCSKINEILETRIQQQIQAHERNVQSLQMSFLSQLEDHKKGSELQLESMEEKLQRQKEEKARAKEACAEYMKSLRAVEQKMGDQETKLVSQFEIYSKKIVELIEKLDKMESKGSGLEEDFNSMLKQVLKHTQQSKQVGMNLQESQAACVSLEKKLTAITQEYGARTMSYCEEVALLKQALTEADREHNLAIATAVQSHASQIQQCMNDMQRLKEGHNRAVAELVREHRKEIGALTSQLQAEKDAEIAEQTSRLDSCLRRKKIECSEEVELMTLEHEKALRELRNALDAAMNRETRLVRTHMNELKTQQEESEDALERCKKECQEALKVSEAVSQKLAHELYDLKEDHIMQIQTMSEKYHSQLSSIEKEWKIRLKSAEDKWEERLENEAATSSKHLQTALDELRNSLLNSFAEEKLKLETERKKEVHDLQAHISELESLITVKEDRNQELLQVIAKMEESSRIALQEMKTSHKQTICDMMERQRAELNDLQKEGSAVIEELQTKNRTALEASQKFAEKAQLQMKEVKKDLEEKLKKLQKRFESRESREEDVVHLMRLQETCLQKDSTIQELHEKTSQLRLELVNREETYNRIFGNSPTVQQGVSDWLRPRAKIESVKVESSRMKAAMDKVDIVKLQKRAASARRMQCKGPEPIIRSASNQL